MPNFPQPAAESPSHRSHADSLVRRLGSRYAIVLAFVAGLIVVDQAVIQPLLWRMDSYAPVINLAGRQRMLSQKLAKSALAAAGSTNEAEQRSSRLELHAALTEWKTAERALRQGSDELSIARIESPDLEREWGAIDHDFEAMVAAAGAIVDGGDAAIESATILAHESSFLERMDRIVDLLEQEAAAELSRLRIFSLAISIAVISLLLLLGWLVVRPATRAIRRQVDELEDRVEQRTGELAASVASLQHEVAEREVAEFREKRLASQLAHADRIASMGHLAVGLAHELNQPLGAIANYSATGEVVLSSMEPTERRRQLEECFNRIGEAALRAGGIVRRIRKFVARNQSDLADAVEVDLATLVREVVELCDFEIRRVEAAAVIDVSSPAAIVEVDPIQIQQVLVNLLQNSLQSLQQCPRESRQLAVTLSIVDDWARLSVVDNGSGFDATDVESPFAPFHTTKGDGLGVGLSICRTIVDAHGGHIAIEPSAAGAHVNIFLPLAQATLPQPNDLRHAPSPNLVCR